MASIVVNMNGPVNTVDHMDDLDREFCLNQKCGCLCCQCHRDKYQFYKSATWWMFHAWWTRTLLVIISTICEFLDGKAALIIFLLCSVASFVILMSAVMRLINLCKYTQYTIVPFYMYMNVCTYIFVCMYGYYDAFSLEYRMCCGRNFYCFVGLIWHIDMCIYDLCLDDYIYESTTNVNGLMKLFMIKTTVSLLVLLSLIAQFLAEFAGGVRAPNDEYPPTAGVVLWYTTRAYCK